ncbi:MAG: SdpI family protein [Thermomicrobiales bacterium]|nr:SdpI family protein [Thermomicrobiales bacterium]
MSEWAITGIILIVTGLVMIGLGRPLVAGKVGRNSLYGYRIAATLRDDRVWYPVNALSGIWLIWAGFLALAIGVLLVIFRNDEDAATLVVLIGVPALIICLIVGVYRGWKLAVAIDAAIAAEEESAKLEP